MTRQLTPRDLSVPRPIDRPTPVPRRDDTELSELDEAKIFAAPEHRAEREAWRRSLHRWRDTARRGYDDSLYRTGPDWPADCAVVVLVWLWDARLYDGTRFTVGSFLARAVEQYGDIDAVVLWHAYPVIGVDERNQWDFYRDVPDLTAVVAAFHDAGVRVFCDYNPWDVGTRRAARSDAEQLAAVVQEYGFDGVFLDTLKHGAPELIETLGRDVALEGESRVPLAAIGQHALSWAQWFADTEAPGVLRAHWFERRHMMHHVRRWNRDHSAELHSAWVNGAGLLVWDDVFGVWVGWNARDRSTLRALGRVRRTLTDVLVDGTWTPLADLDPAAEEAGVFAHRYEHEGITLWTLINRGAADWTGAVLDADDSADWLEVAHGVDVSTSGGRVVVTVPARGIAGLVRVERDSAWAATAHALVAASTPAVPDTTFPARSTAATPTHASAAAAEPPDGTVTIAPGPRSLTVRHRRRETGQHDETPWVDAWKPLPPELHAEVRVERVVDLGAVAVDALEVSNAEFAVFLAATGYTPAVAHRFCDHWIGGAPPPGTEDEPVVYVGPDDARAYAAWRERRLPTAAEWQVAIVEGAARRRPLVWNWTGPQYTDGVSRWCHLKGGSDWRAEGSDWYVDGGPQDPDWELKLVLPGGGLERSSRIGFRCAVDLSTENAHATSDGTGT